MGLATFARERDAIVEVCRKMYARGYIVAADGNVSVRLGPDLVLATPSGTRKGDLGAEALVICDHLGRALPGESGRPSSEIGMHLRIYEVREDVRAIVHAHPPFAVAHSVAGVSLASPQVPEVFCQLGEIETVPYATPTTQDVADAITEPIRAHSAVILERHGSVTVGRTLDEAYDRLEILEHAAKISLFAYVLGKGPVMGLGAEQLAALRALAAP